MFRAEEGRAAALWKQKGGRTAQTKGSGQGDWVEGGTLSDHSEAGLGFQASVQGKAKFVPF